MTPTEMVDGVALLALLKYVNLGIHLVTCWYVLRQLFWSRLTVWVWKEAWLSLSVAMGFILVFRIGDFYDESTHWRLLVASPMSLCFLLGFYRLARLLAPEA